MTFGPEDSISTARMLPATGHPTKLTENLDAAWEAMRSSELSHSRVLNIETAVEEQLSKYNSYTGEPTTFNTKDFAKQYMRDKEEANMSARDRYELLLPKIQELVKARPDLAEEFVLSYDDLEERANARAVAAVEHYKDVGSRSTAGGKAGEIMGTFGAFMTDPALLATMPFGGPIGSGAKGLLAFALREGGLAMAGEVLAQPSVQLYKKELGLDYGFDQALKNIMMGGTFGAGFGLLFGGGVKSVQKFSQVLQRSIDDPVIERGLREAEARADEEVANPNVSMSPDAAQAHQVNMEKSVSAVQRGELPVVIEDPVFNRGDLLNTTGIQTVRRGLDEAGAGIDLAGMDELSVSLRHAHDLNRSEAAVKQLDELSGSANADQLKLIQTVRSHEGQIRQRLREMISIMSDVARLAGRGRKVSVDEVMKELDPDLMFRVNFLEQRISAQSKKVQEQSVFRDKGAEIESKNKFDKPLSDLKSKQAKAGGRQSKQIQKQIDALEQQRAEFIEKQTSTDNAAMAAARKELVDLDVKLRDLAETHSALKSRAEAQLSANAETLKSRYAELEKELEKLHGRRAKAVQELDVHATRGAEQVMPTRTADQATGRGPQEAPGAPEGPSLPPGVAARQSRAASVYERVVSRDEKADEIVEADWAEAKSIMEADPRKSYLFDEIDELGDTRSVPKTGERIQKEIADEEAFLKELEACIAGPGGAA